MPGSDGLTRAVEVVRALRAENGCPWDRAQTHESLRRYLLEETYEVLEALDLGDKSHFEEELGDLLLQVLLHAQIAEDAGTFDIQSLAGKLADKLTLRHPHVFGTAARASSPQEVVVQWEERKKRISALDGIPRELPALFRSLKVIERVSQKGFQWENLEEPIAKVHEELGEFLEELQKAGPPASLNRSTTPEIAPELRARLESELGDLFFTLSNVAFFLHLNPEEALRTMLQRFEKRFRHVEKRAAEDGREWKEMSLAEMDEYWKEAKA